MECKRENAARLYNFFLNIRSNSVNKIAFLTHIKTSSRGSSEEKNQIFEQWQCY